MIATLKIGEESFNLLNFQYRFYRDTDFRGRPDGYLQGGEILIELDSSRESTFTLLEKMFRKPPEIFSGKIEVLNVRTMNPHRAIEFEEAYIGAIGPVTLSDHLPVTLCIFSQRFNISNEFCVEYNGCGWWKPYIPEDTSTYLSQSEHSEQEKECTVYFRRTKDYDGSFGFDWLRTGDTSEPGCGWYKDMMPSVEDYDRFVGEYLHFTQDWRLQYGKYKSTATYLIPYVTLMEGHTARFRVKLCVNEPSGKLRFRVTGGGSQMLSLSYATADADQVGEYYIKDLEVKCIGPLSAVTFIEVYAGQDLVGKMLFLPNHKTYLLDVAIVTVKTQEFHSKKLCARKPDEEVLQGVSRLLGQAYIIPNFVHYELDTNEVAKGKLEKNSKTVYFKNYDNRDMEASIPADYEESSLLEVLFKNNDEKRIYTNSQNGTKYFPSFHSYLNKMLYSIKKEEGNKKEQENLQKKFKLYFIDEETASGNTKSGEAKSNEKAAVIFKNGYNSSTITHELLHCISLTHIFLDNIDVDKNKKHIFKKYCTDNIMDYVKDSDPVDKRKSLWYWQIKQLWENLK